MSKSTTTIRTVLSSSKAFSACALNKHTARIAFVAACFIVLASLFVCTSCSTTASSTRSSSTAGTTSQKSESSTASSAASDTQSEPESYPKSVPFVGMSKASISLTYLGEPAEVGEPLDSGKWVGATPYYWNAHDGTRIFSALVKGGEVVKVNKFQTHYDYWTDIGDVIPGSRKLPNLDGAGEYVELKKVNGRRPDPLDYNSPEAYADDAEDWFSQRGSTDPWNDAYRYWELNAS